MLLISSLIFLIFSIGFFKYINFSNYETITICSNLFIPSKSIFLDRPDLISQMVNKFEGQNAIKTLALVGLGGAGKTTLARYYAHKQHSKVIWEVNAETLDSLHSSFVNLAQALAKTEEDKKKLKEIENIKDFKEQQNNIIQFLQTMLRISSSWVLIYDNVEKVSNIQKYLPQDSLVWGNGKVILTTRDSNIQNNAYIDNIIQIKELSYNQKLNLFIKLMNHGSEYSLTSAQVEEAKIFLKYIPSFPLDNSYLVSTLSFYSSKHTKNNFSLSYANIEPKRKRYIFAKYC